MGCNMPAAREPPSELVEDGVEEGYRRAPAAAEQAILDLAAGAR